MRKNHYKLFSIPKGEDTPCKECDYFLDNGYCTGECSLINRWRIIPIVENWKDDTDKIHTISYHKIKGYIYKRRNKYAKRKHRGNE